MARYGVSGFARRVAERIAVTNGSKNFDLQRNGPKGPWRMALPGFQARANSAKIEELLASLRDLRVRQFHFR